MSTKGETRIDPTLFDGSNYDSWCICILDVLEAIDPILVSIVNVSIYPTNFNWDNFSEEEGKCLQRNAQAANALLSAMSTEIQDYIFKEYGPLKDAHLLWMAIKENYSKPQEDDTTMIGTQNKSQNSQSSICRAYQAKSVTPVCETGLTGFVRKAEVQQLKNKCHRPNEESTSQSLNKSHNSCFMAKRKEKSKKVESESEDDFELDKLRKKDVNKVIKLVEMVEEQDEQLEKQEEFLNTKIEEIKTIRRENENLTRLHESLISKFEKLEKDYACATNSSSCVESLQEEKLDLEAQLRMLTSKHVTLQKDHDMLSCSHDKLVDSHAMLEVAQEVVITSVKSFQLLTQNCTYSQKSLDLSCANSCCFQSKQFCVGDVFVESCDDFIAQENDDLKQEVKRLKIEVTKLKSKVQVQPLQDNCDNMVKKLEKGRTVTRTTFQGSHKFNYHKKHEKNKNNFDHIQCFKCKEMGHFASMCSTSSKDQPRLSRRQRNLSRRRICYGCKRQGHKIASCPFELAEQNKKGKIGLTGLSKLVKPVFTHLAHRKENCGNGPVASRTRQDTKKLQLNKSDDAISKIKKRTCYTCRAKGHLSKDCPNGNIANTKNINSDFDMFMKAKIDTCAKEVISSPHVSARAIWVPKSLLTNSKGPNMTWVPKNT